MSESSKINEGGKAALKAGRRRRLSAALRENLKRRKAQAKARGAAGASDQTAVHTQSEPVAEPHDSAGFADDNRNR